MLGHFILGQKITFGMIVIQSIVLILGLTAYFKMSTSSDLAKKVNEEYLKKSQISQDLSEIVFNLKMNAIEYG